MTVAVALRDAAKLLAETSGTARLDAELLMAEALDMSRSDMLLRAGDLEVPPHFERLVERRQRHEPIAHILGHQEFYGREFLVTPDVLIPRGDSETIVDAALSHCPDDARILDLGTGSGALLLTLLAEKPNASGTGIDASLGAMAVAASNAARLGVSDRVHILHRNWSEAGWRDGLGQFDLIVANPPYVEEDADLEPDVRDYEPARALFAGKDGLDDYRIIIPQLRALLAKTGIAVLEVGHTQAAAVTEIASKEGFSVELHHDLAHRPRALLLR
ncbi:peptide chain release factor N(5)-glutamine methyltransferase [Pontixanthobacter aestiaquae]|uniref:Release factor glutamine methyltransferase n=1 Tax=Pontixanthobacter aestiaquae TaxID=1509367 RepID=A0A844Z2J4_9SPHN|nr:peptide chain release factor N(5)-glutamine methyltransferase [Pontixanthobacter aestiaquae]MDN3647126.1 peptide chain release factor N(5)-glutamine methyltransferase [Pontixanthobacter aestiaquae]MXO81898.1 peptide chain release factor N(5)-glutamine methyltransferase [Pontixanthobacter aestiaquae]